MKKTFHILKLFLLIYSVFSITSCGGGGSKTASTATSHVDVYIGGPVLMSSGSKTAAAIPSNVTSIKIVISAPDMPAIARTVNVAGKSEIFETFDIPNGKHRRFFADAVDAANTILYQGDIYTDIDGTVNRVDILMSHDISGDWSAYHTPQGGIEEGADFVSITQTGNSLVISGANGSGTGAINKNQVQMQISGVWCGAQPATAALTGTTDGNTINGTYTIPGCSSSDANGSWRMVRGSSPTHNWTSWTEPADPAPFQDVLVFVNVNTPGVEVFYEVNGTDGWYQSGSQISDASGKISFIIPGGAAGVQDTVHVWVPSWGPEFTKTWVFIF